MSIFLRFGVPVIVLIVAPIIGFFIPTCQYVQLFIVSLVSGLPIWLLNSILHLPNVVIEGLGTEVSCHLRYNEVMCSILGVIINKSTTGSGELRELTLRVYLSQNKPLDIPIEQRSNVDTNYRFLPSGRYPTNYLWFSLSPVHLTSEEISGKEAEIRLWVIGQHIKIYRVRMSSTVLETENK